MFSSHQVKIFTGSNDFVMFCMAEDTNRNLFWSILKSWLQCTYQLVDLHHRIMIKLLHKTYIPCFLFTPRMFRTYSLYAVQKLRPVGHYKRSLILTLFVKIVWYFLDVVVFYDVSCEKSYFYSVIFKEF